MDRHQHNLHEQHLPRLAHPLGTIVFCVQCFQTLGTETAASPRAILLARHRCIEIMLSKEPAAPPPYS